MLKAIDPLPSHAAVVFEGTGESFRRKIDSQYKANREEMPQDIKDSLEVIMKMCGALGLRNVSANGYEGDDVIGTLALKAHKQRMKTYIISKDKDFKQLLKEDVSLLKYPTKNIPYQHYTLEEFGAEFGGLQPDQWVDVMALAGDKSDNIIGVEGIGEKTAVKLIQQFGSVEAVFENIDEVTQRKKYLQAKGSKDKAYIAKKLLQLKTDITYKQMGIKNLEDLRFMPPKDEGKLADLFFEQYELRGVRMGFNQVWQIYQDQSSMHVV
eukprot:TRINITY_DN8523_c0_g1_i2.p1 TRINITY_DN8523_c0_g1~~TRINITY_DN8523_c0_g1_i2.p1  ORF type:complete len:267 (-),score=36.77 TRINITY_DN8523_c0_g1_i2:1470-2270(-)